MRIVATIARILLGLVFTFAGILSFIITNPPPLPGLAGTFNDAFVHSHWSMFVGAAQLVFGVLLLLNRYVPLALFMLAAFLYNDFAFHLTMAQSALPAPIVVLVLWIIVCLQYRPALAPLFADAKPGALRG